MDPPAPDAPAAEWLVYGDALQEAGNFRGELIGLAHGVEEGRVERAVLDAYVRQHWPKLFGKCPPDTDAYDFTWRFCMVRAATVRVRRGDPDPIAPLLNKPALAALESITLRGIVDETDRRWRPLDLTSHVRQLAERAPPACRSFAFVDDRAARAATLVSIEYSPDVNRVKLGPLAPLWPRAHALSLDVADPFQLDLGTIDAPELRSFALRSLRFAGAFRETLAPRLATARWPRLESLELRLTETWEAAVPLERDPYVRHYSGNPTYADDTPEEGRLRPADWSALVPVLRTLEACPLRRLALTSFASSRSLLEALAAARLPPSLEELDLSDSALGDGDADWLLAHRGLFPGLRRLVVERTRLTSAGAARLDALGATVVHSAADAPRYRYVVGQE